MIALHKHAIKANVSERYATIEYLFEFENYYNNSSKELEFEITIHPSACISGLEANIDGEIFNGITKEKEKASNEYNKAKQNDENCILICQPYPNISNVFKISTNIDSNSKISLNVTIEQFITKKFNFNELNIEIIKSFNKNIKQNYKYITFDFIIQENSGIFDIEISSNNIVIDEKKLNESNNYCSMSGKIYYKNAVNELVLKYKINGEQTDSLILYDKKTKTFCHIISDVITNSMINYDNNIINAPEGQNDEVNANTLMIPRRVVFAIDKSGSMRGGKWTRTIQATIETLKQLRNNFDRFYIVFFNQKTKYMSKEHNMLVANDKNIKTFIQCLQDEKPAGRTNINDALFKSIELIKSDIKLLNTDSDENNQQYNFFMNQIIFITDGHASVGVTETDKILLNVQKRNNLKHISKYGTSKISIFAFGICKDRNDGKWVNDCNHSFLRLLSLQNNGIYQRIKQTHTDTVLCEYYDILSKPILTNIQIKYNHTNIKHVTKTYFDALYAGNDLIICGEIDNNDDEKSDPEFDLCATISAVTGQRIKTNNNKYCTLRSKPINICKEIKLNYSQNESSNNNNNINKLFAYLRLQQFAEQKLLNDEIKQDDDELSPLQLALKHSFITPWTSMIVIKHKYDNNTFGEYHSTKHKHQHKNTKITTYKKKQTKIQKQSFDILDTMKKRRQPKPNIRCSNQCLQQREHGGITRTSSSYSTTNSHFYKLMHHDKIVGGHHIQSDRFRNLINWLHQSGAKFPKLYLKFYTSEYRSIATMTHIKKDEDICFIPYDCIMTTDIAKCSQIGQKIISSKIQLRSKHSYLAAYLLQEREKGNASKWDLYIQILPRKFQTIPLFLKKEQRDELIGSFTLQKIDDRLESFKLEYNSLCDSVPEFCRFELNEFIWARLVVITRIFGFTINDQKTNGLVPMVDMLNHHRPRHVKWTYSEKHSGFVVTAVQQIISGGEIFDSYGRKCNSRYFVNYGFVPESNEDNEALLKLKFECVTGIKAKYLGGNICEKQFQIPKQYNSKKVKEAFSFLRILCAEDKELLLISNGDDVGPLSIRNEMSVLIAICISAKKALSEFSTTLEDDNQLLEDETKYPRYSNDRNIVLQRRGEKEVLKFYVYLTETCSKLLEMKLTELKEKIRKDGIFNDDNNPLMQYINNVVLPLAIGKS